MKGFLECIFCKRGPHQVPLYKATIGGMAGEEWVCEEHIKRDDVSVVSPIPERRAKQ